MTGRGELNWTCALDACRRWLPLAVLVPLSALFGEACTDRAARLSNAGADAFSGSAGSMAAAGEEGVGGDSTGDAGVSASSGGSGGSTDSAIPFDRSSCLSRPAADCQNVGVTYGSGAGFDGTPAFAQCSEFNSHDGCGKLIFEFDADGCVVAVTPGAASWPADEHLVPLRECLSDALRGSRWPCLASGTLRYDESCFPR